MSGERPRGGHFIQGLRRKALMVGLAGAAVSALGIFFDPVQFFRSYLMAFNCCLAVGLGSLPLRLVHSLTGGRWGLALRQWLEAATKTMPLLLLFFMPVALGVHHLYPWSDIDDPALSEHTRRLLEDKEFFLNVPFFFVRAAIYFAVWLVLVLLLNRWSWDSEHGTAPGVGDRLETLSGVGLILYGLTMTFAAIDWTMSLEPEWYSTIFGILVATGQMLPAFALAVAGMAWLLNRHNEGAPVDPQIWNDLGNLLLTFVMLWTYMSFAQLLLIWAGDLPEEIVWYKARAEGGWEVVGILLAVFYFGLPFVILLSRNFKRDPGRLMRLAAGIVLVSVIHQHWLVAPAFSPGKFSLHWLDISTLAGLGGIWAAVFFWQLGTRPLLPAPELLAQEAQHA